jgi:hypothetical protein
MQRPDEWIVVFSGKFLMDIPTALLALTHRLTPNLLTVNSIVARA